ncbi:Gfo/Idh/MocA family oxidoreductase [Paenibacillus woosongensis]|uniref:Dehydrogenase n=1 Tax=Paenibacillus woosongensis TaxID=307580 RepID=A0AA95KWV9_9BACL|nr:Gfo/Idh/MocA family oxidoreductase [Paenibacillus woosongensis]WHX50125.1 Gfo/Idh/MocA family oxidoreductase [Paenibacillus woosongensis]GIP59798.1 dehydrogenase [Paenibacillus woosongensis]
MKENTRKTIRWGIMGTGWIAEKFAADLTHVSNGEGMAVGSRTLNSANQFAAKFNIPRAYGSYEELVSDPEIDAIYVATPHPFHRDNVITALSGGKAVLCEKPFTVNSRELEEIIALAKEKRLFLMEAMWTRFLPPIIQVRQWLEEGRIGEIKLLKAEFGFRSDWNPSGRLLNPELGGGALLDAGIYPVSFASMIFGPNPEQVWSTAHIGETGVDEHFSILLDYGQGRSASLHGAVRLALTNEAYIYGTEGSIHIPSFLNATKAVLHVNGQEPVEVKDDRTAVGYAFEAEEVGRCLLAGETESSAITLAESLGIMQLLDQLRAQWGLKYPFE